MAELLPCPFCGGEARLLHLDYEDSRVWGVFCSNDIDDEYSHGHFIDNYATDVEAIEAWNTRAERTCHQVDVTAKYQPYVTHITACSLCGETLAVEEYSAPNFCPNCGAKVVDE